MSDLRRRVIPNRYPAAIVAAFFPLVAAGGVPAWPSHLLVFAGVFAVCLALFAGGVLGGGDAKLIPAVALWAGPNALAPFLLATTLGGGALALGVLLKRKTAAGGEAACGTETGDPAAHGPDESERGATSASEPASAPAEIPPAEIPYGLAIALGGLIVATEPLLNALSAHLALVSGNGV